MQLGEGAQLDYVAVQQAGDEARVLISRGARCERDATVRWHLADLGGALVRTVLDAQLAAPGAHAADLGAVLQHRHCSTST